MITIIKDTKVWEKVKKDLLKQARQDLELRIGFFEESKYGDENDNLQVAQVAQWNEEGSENNPTRPFMRVGFMGPIQKGIYRDNFKLSINAILEGRSTFAAEYKKLGPMAVEDLKSVIDEWSTPPNSPSTVEEKGFNDPLIWTGTMRNSVDYKIEKGD